jgi:hypothetical protein
MRNTMTTTLLEPPTVLAGGKPPNRFETEQLIAPAPKQDAPDAGGGADLEDTGDADVDELDEEEEEI